MTAASPEPISETTAFQDLVKWSADRPAWQRDALRRLVQNGALTDQDVEELAAICADPAAACQPVDTSHIAVGSTSTDPITLHAVRAPKGINALAPDQSLEFAPQGLTIICGDNGSGKSGYVRIHPSDGGWRKAGAELSKLGKALCIRPPCRSIEGQRCRVVRQIGLGGDQVVDRRKTQRSTRS